jgi:hypothetical protein
MSREKIKIIKRGEIIMAKRLKLRIMALAAKMVRQCGAKDTKEVLSETKKNYKSMMRLIDQERK